jgi:O-antigen/teichoic acid export membrane protein
VENKARDQAAEPAPAIASRRIQTELPTLIRRTGGVGALRIVAGLLGFAGTVVLARLLGGREYGYYALSLAWASFLAEPTMEGLGKLLLRAVARYEVTRDWARMSGVIRRMNQLVLTISSVIVCVGSLVAVALLGPSLRVPFILGMFLVGLIGLTFLREAVMQGLGHVVIGQIPEFIIRPVLLLSGLGLLASFADRPTAGTAMCITLGAVAGGYLVGAGQMRRHLPEAVRTCAPIFETRQWLWAGIPMMMVGAAWSINTYIGTVIVGAIDTATAAGVLSVIQKGMAMVAMVLLAGNSAMAPAIVRLYAKHDLASLEHTVERMTRLIVLGTLPLAGALMLFPTTYLQLFGSDFTVGADATVILAFGQLFSAAVGPAGNVLMMTGYERLALLGVSTGLVINVIMTVVLVPVSGLTGAAVASALSTVVWNLALALAVRQRVGINTTVLPALACQVR